MRISRSPAIFSSLLCLVAATGIVYSSTVRAETAAKVQWQPWTDDLFTNATRDHKLVILDLEAVWCHWCHVMEEKTYSDPKVIQELGEHFIAVRVDQDSRPDISNRFEDYGWPATILFDSSGKVLARRSGYIEPQETLTMLKAFVADPTPGPSASDDAAVHYAAAGPLTKKQVADFIKLIKEEYDYKLGGWKATHKFLDANLAEWFLRESFKGGSKTNQAADLNYKKALDSQLAILDPVWGGFYQYSAESDWKHPHFEKIMSIQADNLRAYSIALRDPKIDAHRQTTYRAAAGQVIDFVDHFLTSPDGTFYVSQDADVVEGEHAAKFFALDDQHRRAIGIPKVDHHVYSRENGWMISAFLENFAATGNADLLKKAIRATDWIMQNRKQGDLFSHDKIDKAGPYLGDNISMATAFLNLYVATGDRKWLKEAEALGHQVLVDFSRDGANPGLATVSVRPKKPVPASPSAPPSTVAGTSPSVSTAYQVKPQFEENFKAARFFNLLFYYTGNKNDKAAAVSIFSFLASSSFEGSIYASAAILLMNEEIANPPLHIVVSGPKADPQAARLFQTALNFPNTYKVLEWWDKKDGPLPNPDDSYPTLDKSAAFVCADHRCSFPAFQPEEIAVRVKQLTGFDAESSGPMKHSSHHP